MEYLTISQTAEKWGIKGRRVTALCSEGRIPGAKRFGNAWMVPEDAEKPTDARIKSGNYIGFSQQHRKNNSNKEKVEITSPHFEPKRSEEKTQLIEPRREKNVCIE